jgi:hypothetical protein
MEMLMQVNREEEAERREQNATKKARSHLLDYDRNTDGAVIDANRKEYLNQNRQTFAELVAKARQNKDTSNKENKQLKDQESHSPLMSPAAATTISEPKVTASMCVLNDGDLSVMSEDVDVSSMDSTSAPVTDVLESSVSSGVMDGLAHIAIRSSQTPHKVSGSC